MLQDDAPVQLKDQVIIAGGPKSRHRAWPASRWPPTEISWWPMRRATIITARMTERSCSPDPSTEAEPGHSARQ